MTNASARASGSLPPHFPGNELVYRGPQCIVYLGLAQGANARPGGRDGPIMEQAQSQWQAALEYSNIPEQEWRQMVGSSVNALRSTPAAQRDAAVAWCVEHAPEVDL